MGLPVALPSPPNGHPAVQRLLSLRLRRMLARSVTLEPGDEPAYLAAGSVLFTWGVHAANALLSLDPLSTFLWLTNVERLPIWTVVGIAQLLGFLSRSRTARTIATLSASLLALGFATFYVTVIPAFVGEIAQWGVRTGMVAATVLWSLRALRRWISPEDATGQ